MKKILIWVVSPILLAIACVAGTIAYLTDTDEEKNVVTVGEARIELREYQRDGIEKNQTDDIVEFENDKLLLPSVVPDGFAYNTTPTENYVIWNADHNGEAIIVGGNTDYTSPIWKPTDITNEIDKMVFVKNTGNCNVYVRICFAFEAGNYVWKSHFDRMVHLNKNETDWTWTWDKTGDKVNLYDIDGTRYFIAWATYKHVLPAGEHTKISLSQIALDFSAINDHSRAFGEKYEVKAFAQGIQADGFDSASAAIAKGFGNEIPFRNVKEVTFTKLSTALKYLNGENSEENKITKKVKNITFGLTKDHSAKVEGHEGVLVANLENQADFTAYAYYVPDGSNYDVYILADGWKIYTPNSSSSLFMGMEALTTVNTANMDVSHTTNMMAMFSGCSNLVDIDIGNWDTSNVTKMANMFDGCSSLETLEAGTWNVSSVTSFNFMFRNCRALENIDVKNWNVSNAQSISSMFYSCFKLRVLDLSNWNTTKVTSCTLMFADCTELTTIYVGDDWNIDKVIATMSSEMFKNCTKLVGGNGTTLEKIKESTGDDDIDNTYARIDGKDGKLGYLTDIKDKPANP